MVSVQTPPQKREGRQPFWRSLLLDVFLFTLEHPRVAFLMSRDQQEFTCL
jgi:hypothetical protein